VSELVLVQVSVLHRLVALALLVQAMLPEAVLAVVVVLVEAKMAGLAAEEAREKGLVVVHTLKFPFPNKLEREPSTHF
jgi:hypothetical protein